MLCAILCKSIKTFLAGVLLIVLIVVGITATYIAKYLACPSFGINDLLKSIRKQVWKTAMKQVRNKISAKLQEFANMKKRLVKIIKWLQNSIYTALHFNSNDEIYVLMNTLLASFNSKGFSNSNDLNDGITSFINIDPEMEELFNKIEPSVLIIKIAILFILLIAAYIKGFKSIKQLKQYASSYQNEFTKNEKKTNKSFEYYNSYNEAKNDVEKSCIIREIVPSDDE